MVLQFSWGIIWVLMGVPIISVVRSFLCCFVCEFSDGQRYTPGFGQIDLLVLRCLVMFGVVWVKLGNLS